MGNDCCKIKKINSIPTVFYLFIFFSTLCPSIFSCVTNTIEASEVSDLTYLGNTAFSIGDYKKADYFYTKSLAIEPDNFLVTRDLAKTRIKLEKFQEALLLKLKLQK